MRYSLIAFALAGPALLAACGGGGTTSPMPPATTPISGSPTAPVPPPSSPPSTSSVLQTTAVSGSTSGNPTFVTATGLPVYMYALDVAGQPSMCAGPFMPVPPTGTPANCLSAWPPVSPPQGVTLVAPWSSIINNDTKQPQLAFNGLPLYTFFVDTPGTAKGDNVEQFHLAHPTAATSSPPVAQGPNY